MAGNAKRDLFAPPGYPGNRGIQYGKDGPIPGQYRPAIEKAIRLAYSLTFNAEFEKIFKEQQGRGTTGSHLKY